MNEIRFWKTTDEYGIFSNFANTPIKEKGIIYQTSEHYFQSKKFEDEKEVEHILLAESPKEAAIRGRDRTKNLRRDWEDIKDKIMFQTLELKAEQNPRFKKKLLSTGEALIIENTPFDYYWGCGGDNTGTNMLGILLMALRKKLRKTDAI